MKRLSTLLFAVAFWMAAPCLGQDIGNVALRTVSATVATGTTCTGAAQNFITGPNAGVPAGTFINLGQTSHLATATSNASQFQMEIDGIDNLSNVFRLSDLQLGVPTSAKGGLVVTASGYMTKIQISVTCSPGATFSISYSGSFSPQPPNIAGALLSSVEKLPFQTAQANASSSTTFQTPSGNSQGTIVFQYAAAGPAGSVINVQCLSNAGINLSLFSFNPATVSTAQLFNVTSGPCPFVTLSYVTGGASATTYNLEYVFVAQGTNTNTTTVNGTVGTVPPANASTNLTQLNGATLGSPSNYGTSPGAVAVPGVNAFVTNTPSVNVTNTPSINTAQLNGAALGSPSNYGTSPGAVAVPGVNAFVTNNPNVTLTAADPCANPNIQKLSVQISVGSALSTQLVAISGSTTIFVCGFNLSITATTPAATTTATLTTGTGAACATGTSNLTGQYFAGATATAPSMVVSPAVTGSVVKTPASQALCINTTGTAINVQGVLTYVQQ